MRRGPVRAGEKVQLTDRKGKMLTLMLEVGAVTQTHRGFLAHDRLIGQEEGSIVTTLSAQELQTIQDQSEHAVNVSRDSPKPEEALYDQERDLQRKPWKAARSQGGWQFTLMRPRLNDFILSMPRGAQIMYPKDIAQVLSIGDIRSGMRVLESGAGSGAMSIALLDAVGAEGSVTTVEIRPEFARVAEGNTTVYFGGKPSWWELLVGSFDQVVMDLPAHSFDRVVLDMLDPWNRISAAWQVLAPGGVFTAYVTTTTQLSRLSEALRASCMWTEPEILETFERSWKSDGLAVRPQHEMIGHTGFLLVSRAMAADNTALRRRNHAAKDPYADIDNRSDDSDSQHVPSDDASLAQLELRDISDRKLRKVLRDLQHQEQQVRAGNLE